MKDEKALIKAPMYELTGEFNQLLAMLDEDGPDEAILDTLASIKMDISQKARQTLYFHKNLEAEAGFLAGRISVLQREIDRLKAKENSFLNLADRVKEGIRQTLLLIGKRKLKFEDFTAYLQKTTPPVIVEQKDLPDTVKIGVEGGDPEVVELWKTTRAPRLKVIGDLLKKGAPIPGASFGESKQVLHIK